MAAVAMVSDAGSTPNHRIETGETMTASFADIRAARSGPTPAAALTAAFVGGISVLTLMVVGITFFALAVAFPIALPMAQAYNIPVPASDIALAARFAELSWAFAALAFASFGAALVVIVKVVSFLSPAPRD